MNKVVCGDCLDVLPTLPNDSIDLVFTSPPYKNSYEGIGIRRGKKVTKFHYDNDVGEPLYVIIDVSKILLEKLKVEGFYLLNLGFNSSSGALRPFYIIERLRKQGWFCPDVIIWHKSNPIPNTAYQLTNSFEYIFILTKQPTYKLPVETRVYIHNVWKIPIVSGTPQEHNAAFPLELAKRVIKHFTREGDLVVDPFVGTGTTLEAAASLNRKRFGIDINPKYCEITKRKLSQTRISHKEKEVQK